MNGLGEESVLRARSSSPAKQQTWSLLSTRGTLFFYVAVNPGCTGEEMVEAFSLTPRTIWRLIGDLRRAGMLWVRRNGRRHHYFINPDTRDPVFGGKTFRQIVEPVAEPEERS
jgi:hypothetical protein